MLSILLTGWLICFLQADAGTKATLLQTLLPGLLPPGQDFNLDSALSVLSAITEQGDKAAGTNSTS